MIYLQVIWAIGLAMLALSVLLWLPRAMQIGLAALIIFGHNALDGVQFTRDAAGFIPWAILHDRSVIELGGGLAVRTSLRFPRFLVCQRVKFMLPVFPDAAR